MSFDHASLASARSVTLNRRGGRINNKSPLLLLLALVATACGDTFLGECQTREDCIDPLKFACVPFGDHGTIPGEVEPGTPGICRAHLTSPSILHIHEIAPGENTEDGFIAAPTGEYDEVFSSRTYFLDYIGDQTKIEWEGVAEYPYRTPDHPPNSWGMTFGLEYNTRLVGIDDASFEVECNLVFGEGGHLVEGGVTIHAGNLGERGSSSVLICPTNEPGTSGIRVEHDFFSQ